MKYWINNLLVICDTLINGVSLHLTFSLAGVMFLGFPTIMKFSAYGMAVAMRFGMSANLAWMMAIVLAVLAGLLFAWLFTVLSPDSFAVIGLASILATEALLNSWDSLTNGVLGIAGIARPEIFSNLSVFAILVAAVAILILILERILLSTWIGRALRAYKEDPFSLEAIGVNSKKLVQMTIILGSILTAIAEIFYLWRIQFIDPKTHGITELIELISIVILASRAKVLDLILAAVFVEMLPEILRFVNLPQELFAQLRVIIYGVLLIIVVQRISGKFKLSKRTI